eukprot:scaffold6861_cov248-Ochromonas_danica.AAC.24
MEFPEELLFAECAFEACGLTVVESATYHHCASMLAILRRKLHMETAIIVKENANHILFRQFNNSKIQSFVYIEDLQSNSFIKEEKNSLLCHSVRSMLSMSIMMTTGVRSTLILSSPQPHRFTQLELAIASDLGGCIEDQYQARRAATIGTTLANLRLCSVLVTGVKGYLNIANEALKKVKEGFDNFRARQGVTAKTVLSLTRLFQSHLADLDSSILRSTLVAQYYYRADRDRYYLDTFAAQPESFTKNLNGSLMKLTSLLPDHHLLWCFNLEANLANAPHFRTFPAHLLFFLETLIFLWTSSSSSQKISASQILLGFEKHGVISTTVPPVDASGGNGTGGGTSFSGNTAANTPKRTRRSVSGTSSFSVRSRDEQKGEEEEEKMKQALHAAVDAVMANEKPTHGSGDTAHSLRSSVCNHPAASSDVQAMHLGYLSVLLEPLMDQEEGCSVLENRPRSARWERGHHTPKSPSVSSPRKEDLQPKNDGTFGVQAETALVVEVLNDFLVGIDPQARATALPSSSSSSSHTVCMLRMPCLFLPETPSSPLRIRAPRLGASVLGSRATPAWRTLADPEERDDAQSPVNNYPSSSLLSAVDEARLAPLRPPPLACVRRPSWAPTSPRSTTSSVSPSVRGSSRGSRSPLNSQADKAPSPSRSASRPAAAVSPSSRKQQSSSVSSPRKVLENLQMTLSWTWKHIWRSSSTSPHSSTSIAPADSIPGNGHGQHHHHHHLHALSVVAPVSSVPTSPHDRNDSTLSSLEEEGNTERCFA